jgi:L-asparaginase II
MGAPAPLVRVVRSGLVESVHLGHVAVCDAEGRLLGWAGDPDRPVFVRSCLKPIQSAVSQAAMGLDERLPERLIAITCASHNGEAVHLRAVRDLLARGGLTAENLPTPPDYPTDPRAMARSKGKRPEFHNCSGKHAGMLLACVRAGWPTETYRDRAHPLQRRVIAAVRATSGVARPTIGVDGCGVPTPGMPLRAVATMYARLAAPEGDLAPFLQRAATAMRSRPYLVGGRNRDDTAVMAATGGLLMKEGAEALDCVVALDAGIGIAVKVADGGYRATGPVVIAVLRRLGLMSAAERRTLAPVALPEVRGGGRSVGRIEPVVELRSRR